MPDSREQTLYRAAKAGGWKAFDRLQLLLDGSVRRYIRRLVGVIDEEDEITQDVFLALYMNLSAFVPRAAFVRFCFASSGYGRACGRRAQ